MGQNVVRALGEVKMTALQLLTDVQLGRAPCWDKWMSWDRGNWVMGLYGVGDAWRMVREGLLMMLLDF